MDTITIPANFDNLHDLGELVSNYNVMSKLQNALNNYQDTYFNSFIKTYDEVLDYIPKSEYDNYKIRSENDYLFYCQTFTKDNELHTTGYKRANINTKIKTIESDWANRDCYYKSYAKINEYHLRKNTFIINDIKKEIIVLHKKPEYLPADHSFVFKDNKYTVNSKKQQLTVEAPFESHETQTIGGVWINGQKRGYLSGNYTHVPYVRYGYFKYIFDTDINKFIDYEYYIDEQREWEPIKSRF